jgi:methylisocitrate lyase
MVQKIRAALDAREDPNFQIIARTDIADVTGSPLDALERMLAYLDAGADAVMPGALDVAQLATIRARIPGKVVLVNTAGASVADEQAAGVDVAIYHGLCLQAAQHAIEQSLRTFTEQRDIRALDGSLASSAALDALTGYEDFNRRAAEYCLIDP